MGMMLSVRQQNHSESTPFAHLCIANLCSSGVPSGALTPPPSPQLTFVSKTIDLRNGLETQAKVYASSVIRFALEPCNFTLNTFQDFVFTYFKQEQKCECNYRLLKLFRGINKAENHHLMFP